MDVFALRDHLVGEYAAFARSFTKIKAADLREQIDAAYARNRYWPEPYIQINPRYQGGRTVAELVAAGTVHARCAEIFRTDRTPREPEGAPLPLWKHQEQAITAAAHGRSFVVTTGTGSGKSLCFFVPIVDAVLREKDRERQTRTRAIVIYPMNALANGVFGVRVDFGEASRRPSLGHACSPTLDPPTNTLESTRSDYRRCGSIPVGPGVIRFLGAADGRFCAARSSRGDDARGAAASRATSCATSSIPPTCWAPTTRPRPSACSRKRN